MEHLDSFGEWLRQRRRALDLTQVDLAERVGCSVSGLRKIESDDRRPSRQMAELFAQHLQIPPDKCPMFVKVARGMERVVRLGTPVLASATVRPRATTPRPASNLPIPPTPLIGRESELDALAQLLYDAQCRLLTVAGAGGIGKTRLAIEITKRFQSVFPDGAHFISLASLASPALLVPAIANALNFAFQGQKELRVQLFDYLSGKQALLVLDNLEHLLDGAGLLAELLVHAPRVKLLVTSRERLNLQGEWVFEVQGLPVPALDQVAHTQNHSSVALFVQSARRARSDFELQADEWPSVTRICQAVEGMPLGIELAAAWVSVLTCREIAHEIERGLDFLTTRMRDMPERQRSLRAVFDHSWNLLSTDEQRVLARLAIFQGGFGREAAEHVAGAALPSLLALASKSLVRQMENGRYDLHEVVRQYALSHLADDPQGTAARDRHSGFYLALLRDRETALKSAAQREAIRELTDEIDNVRAAWAWAVNHAKFAALGAALRCFGWFYEMKGWFREGFAQVERVVQALQAGPADEGQQNVLGQALAQQGLLLFRQGRFDRAQALFETSLSILRPMGNPDPMLEPLTFSGIIMYLRGEIDRARLLAEESLSCSRAAGDRWFEAYALYNRGAISALPLGRYTEAYAGMLEGLEIWRTIGDPRATALGLNWISPTAVQLGRYEEAEAYLQESLALCTQLGDRWGLGTAYRHLGLSALAQGSYVKAQAHLRESLAVFGGFITGWDVVQSLIYLAQATAAAGDPSEAERIYLDALGQAVKAEATSLALDVLAGLAGLKAQAGMAEQALALSLCVQRHAAGTREAQDRVARVREQAESQLTPQQMEAVQACDEATSFDVWVAELLNAPSAPGLPPLDVDEL